MKDEAITEILPDLESMSLRLANWIDETAQNSNSRFSIALTGGATPRRLYQLLGSSPFRDRMPWSRVHLFWGDERFVPHDHPDSNYGMARDRLISRIPIPPENVHPIPTGGTPEEAAQQYDSTLKCFYGASDLEKDRPLFDIVLLGLGTDGHIASLFPGTQALEERSAWVTSVIGAKPEPRISLTFKALSSSRTLAFIVAGGDKCAIAARVRAGEAGLPATRVGGDGRIRWFMDRAAAGL